MKFLRPSIKEFSWNICHSRNRRMNFLISNTDYWSDKIFFFFCINMKFWRRWNSRSFYLYAHIRYLRKSLNAFASHSFHFHSPSYEHIDRCWKIALFKCSEDLYTFRTIFGEWFILLQLIWNLSYDFFAITYPTQQLLT